MCVIRTGSENVCNVIIIASLNCLIVEAIRGGWTLASFPGSFTGEKKPGYEASWTHGSIHNQGSFRM